MHEAIDQQGCRHRLDVCKYTGVLLRERPQTSVVNREGTCPNHIGKRCPDGGKYRFKTTEHLLCLGIGIAYANDSLRRDCRDPRDPHMIAYACRARKSELLFHWGI